MTATPHYGILTTDPSRRVTVRVGPVHTDAELVLARARHEADYLPDGAAITPVTIIPGIIPPRQPGKVRVYLAGPMTGRAEWNFPAFREAATELRAAGFDVVSPHELDEVTGFDSTAPVNEFTQEHLLAALRRDMLAVLDVDGVATLDGWELSKGARAEAALAYAARKPARSVAEWLRLYPEGTYEYQP